MKVLDRAAAGDPEAIHEFDQWVDSVIAAQRAVEAGVTVSQLKPRVFPWWFKLLAKAVPTCRLWRYDYLMYVWRFVLWPKWIITDQDLYEVGA